MKLLLVVEKFMQKSGRKLNFKFQERRARARGHCEKDLKKKGRDIYLWMELTRERLK